MADVRGVGPYFLKHVLGKGQTGKIVFYLSLIYFYFTNPVTVFIRRIQKVFIHFNNGGFEGLSGKFCSTDNVWQLFRDALDFA